MSGRARPCPATLPWPPHAHTTRAVCAYPEGHSGSHAGPVVAPIPPSEDAIGDLVRRCEGLDHQQLRDDDGPIRVAWGGGLREPVRVPA